MGPRNKPGALRQPVTYGQGVRLLPGRLPGQPCSTPGLDETVPRAKPALPSLLWARPGSACQGRGADSAAGGPGGCRGPAGGAGGGVAGCPLPSGDIKAGGRSPPVSSGAGGTMTAIGAQAQRLLAHRRPQKSFFETLIRSLIILCVAIAVVLSSISVCDGRWLFARGQLFGLWHFCTVSNGSVLKCVTDLSLAKVEGLSMGVIPVRSMVSFAVVVAIFGLELLMVSQVCEDANARRKWSMGSVLILASFLLSATGVLSFSILVKDHLTFTGFTLTYWCEFIAAFLFFLNGISGLHINSLTHPRNRVGKI